MTDDVNELVEAFEGLLSSVDQLFPTDGPVKARARAALEALSRDGAGEQKVVADGVGVRAEVIRILREDFDPTPLNWGGPNWCDNAPDVADAIIARLAAQPVAAQEVVAWRAFCPSTGGKMVNQIKEFLVRDADAIYDEGKWELQELGVIASPAPDEVRRMALEEAADYLKERVEANKGLPCSLPLSEAEAAIRSLASAPPAEDPKDAADSLCSDCPPIGYPTDETRCAPCPRRAALRASSEKEPKT